MDEREKEKAWAAQGTGDAEKRVADEEQGAEAGTDENEEDLRVLAPSPRCATLRVCVEWR